MTVAQPLSRTSDGRLVPPARDRHAARRGPTDVLDGWLVTLGVTVLAGFLRFWHLGRPHEFVFDETYYAKDAWSLWRHGYARNWVEGADAKILAGHWSPRLQTDSPTMVVHPEVSKWLIGAGEHLLGFDPVGWRFASAVAGTLMVAVMVRLARRLTGSTLLGGVAGLLLCFDGLQLTLSRLALVDIFVALFLLAAVACLVADRDRTRARMAGLARDTDVAGWGPVRGMWWRPWRLAAGVLFGLAVGSKWSALLPLAAFGVLVVVWDAGARRALGVRKTLPRAALVDGVPAFCYLVVVAAVVYVATWTGWLLHAEVFERAFAVNSYGPPWGDYVRRDPDGFWPSLVQGLRDLYHYHQAVWGFHSGGLAQATHPYQSHPLGWPVMQRPVVAATQLDIAPGAQGCTAPADSTCLREVVMLGTPVLWWGGVVALLHAAYAWVARRDWRYGVVVVGFLAAWLPFFRYADRPIFSFYAVIMLPFTVLAVTLLLGRVLGPAAAGRRRRAVGATAAGSFVVLVVLQFAWLWPVYTYGLLSTPAWLDRIWFGSWI